MNEISIYLPTYLSTYLSIYLILHSQAKKKILDTPLDGLTPRDFWGKVTLKVTIWAMKTKIWLPSLKRTASLPLKMEDWKTTTVVSF